MKYLNTRSGLLAECAIDLIESLSERPSGESYHRITYHVGNDPRETTASEIDVLDFLEPLNSALSHEQCEIAPDISSDVLVS